jgi:hypothetical protein
MFIEVAFIAGMSFDPMDTTRVAIRDLHESNDKRFEIKAENADFETERLFRMLLEEVQKSL